MRELGDLQGTNTYVNEAGCVLKRDTKCCVAQEFMMGWRGAK